MLDPCLRPDGILDGFEGIFNRHQSSANVSVSTIRMQLTHNAGLWSEQRVQWAI